MENDCLYHLGLCKENAMEFSQVKYVCIGGTDQITICEIIKGWLNYGLSIIIKSTQTQIKMESVEVIKFYFEDEIIEMEKSKLQKYQDTAFEAFLSGRHDI